MKKKVRFFNIIPDEGGVGCTILLFGYIGEYDQIRSADITAQLIEAAKVYKEINVRINSPGGDIATGIAIFNALRNIKVDVKLFVDGIAASMGAVLALCGHPLFMSKFSKLMLHGANGGCYGNRKELEKYLELMEDLEKTLCAMLAKKCGKTPEELREAYFDGTDHWLTAEEALELGFIDGIYDADPVTVAENSTPEEIFAVFHNKYENSLNKEQMFEKLKKLASFTDCVDEVAVLKRIDEMRAAADKVPVLEKEKADLQARLDAKDKEEAEARTKRIEDILDKAIKVDQKFGEPSRVGLRNMLNVDLDSGIAFIDAQPKKVRVAEQIENNTDPATGKDPFAQRMQEIRDNLKK